MPTTESQSGQISRDGGLRTAAAIGSGDVPPQTSQEIVILNVDRRRTPEKPRKVAISLARTWWHGGGIGGEEKYIHGGMWGPPHACGV